MNLLDLIKTRKILLDGAMGSMLIAKGMKMGDVPELWNINHQKDIIEIHQNYTNAGADAALTNTFGGSPIKLAEKGIENVGEIISNAVANAKNASEMVIGDIGPTGKFLPPMGKMSEEKLFETFQVQAKHLINEGVDAILIETMYDLREALAAIKAVRSVDNQITIMATMTFDKKKRGFFTIMGDQPQMCYDKLAEMGANIVGANCTLDSDDMLELARVSRELTDLPLLFQANAGQPEVRDGKVHYPQKMEHYAKNMVDILGYADLIGGCCGTTPEYIKKIKELME